MDKGNVLFLKFSVPRRFTYHHIKIALGSIHLWKTWKICGGIYDVDHEHGIKSYFMFMVEMYSWYAGIKNRIFCLNIESIPITCSKLRSIL